MKYFENVEERKKALCAALGIKESLIESEKLNKEDDYPHYVETPETLFEIGGNWYRVLTKEEIKLFLEREIENILNSVYPKDITNYITNVENVLDMESVRKDIGKIIADIDASDDDKENLKDILINRPFEYSIYTENKKLNFMDIYRPYVKMDDIKEKMFNQKDGAIFSNETIWENAGFFILGEALEE